MKKLPRFASRMLPVSACPLLLWRSQVAGQPHTAESIQQASACPLLLWRPQVAKCPLIGGAHIASARLLRVWRPQECEEQCEDRLLCWHRFVRSVCGDRKIWNVPSRQRMAQASARLLRVWRSQGSTALLTGEARKLHQLVCSVCGDRKCPYWSWSLWRMDRISSSAPFVETARDSVSCQ